MSDARSSALRIGQRRDADRAGPTPIDAPSGGGRAFLVAAVVGHAALLLMLSLAWSPQAKREWPKPQPMEVSLVTDVAPEATAPPSPEPPAPSIAPDEGQPQEAPPPTPVPAAKPQPITPTPPQPVAKPLAKPVVQPKPAPVTVTKPQPPAPAKAVPTKPAPAKTVARPSRLTGLQQTLAAGAKADAAPAKQRGRRLGDNFLSGLAPDAAATKASAAAPGAKAGPYPTASIVQAIARQIQPCADRQVNPGPGANQIVTTLNIRLNQDGSLAATPRMVRQAGVDGENDRYAQRVVDLGVAAFKGCSPLKLPAEYYQTGNGGWSNINYQWKLR